jgi:inhibitor of KinA
MMDIIPFGADSLLVNFEQQIALDVSEKVGQLSNYLIQQTHISAIIPAYCSITVSFNKEKTSFKELEALIQKFSFEGTSTTSLSRSLHIPVCYAPEFGLDIIQLSETLSLSTDDLIELHSEKTYHTYMIGFLPGFPYLGKTADQLSCKRLSQPRKRVLAGSVGLAGNQTGIYPMDAPGGWQIIGKIPLPIFQPTKQTDFLLKAGDKVTFSAISLAEFQAIENEIKTGTFKWEAIYD